MSRGLHILSFFLCVALSAVTLAFPCAAFADDFVADVGWKVTYTQSGRMDDNYSAQEYVEQVSRLQPGDTILFEVALSHENSESADWYMQNEVIKTLEEQAPVMAAKFSAYSYELVYEQGGSRRVLYDSNTVGGDVSDGDREGLAEATDALHPQDYLYLGRLSKGESAKITLRVGLDGETEGNAYFDTLARLKIRFAVEPVVNPKSEVKHNTVKRATEIADLVRTGDDMRLFPFYIAMLVSGGLLLILFGYEIRLRTGDDE